METSLVMSFALIGVLGLACQWIAWRLRLPAILFLLITGIIAGPGVHWLDPDALFGDMLFPLVSMAVAVILFEGSLTLKFTEIQGMEGDVITMSDIFEFEQTGIEGGKIIGRIRPTGLRPKFIDRIEASGIHLPPSTFGIGRSNY